MYQKKGITEYLQRLWCWKCVGTEKAWNCTYHEI